MVLPVAFLSSPETTAIVVGAICVVLIIGVVAAKGRGSFFGKFRVAGVTGEVRSSTPPGIDLKNSSAGRHITVEERTGKRVAGEGLSAGQDLTVSTTLPSDQDPK